jgi:hypothetical protein
MSEELYGWDAARQRFVSLTTGRFVSGDEVMELMRDRLAVGFERMKAYSDALAAGTAEVSEWQNAMMVELRRSHTQLAALGSGGWDNVSPSVWGEVGSRLKAEYQYLEGFAKEIADGNLSAAQIEARIDSYAHDAWGSYSDAERISQENAGKTEERAVLEAGAEHCEDCMARADQGWQPIGTLPDIGDSQCGSKCECSFEYQ